MTINFRPLPNAHDTALQRIRAETTRRLIAEVAAERAPRPRHFEEAQIYKQTGER